APAPKPLTPADAAKAIALENRGIAHLERFDYKDAVDDLRAAVALAPTWVTGRYNLALALLHLGRDDSSEAAKMLEQVLRDAPDHPHALFMSGWLAERSADSARALDLYAK